MRGKRGPKIRPRLYKGHNNPQGRCALCMHRAELTTRRVRGRVLGHRCTCTLALQTASCPLLVVVLHGTALDQIALECCSCSLPFHSASTIFNVLLVLIPCTTLYDITFTSCCVHVAPAAAATAGSGSRATSKTRLETVAALSLRFDCSSTRCFQRPSGSDRSKPRREASRGPRGSKHLPNVACHLHQPEKLFPRHT